MAIAIGVFESGKGDGSVGSLHELRFTHRHCPHPVLQQDRSASPAGITLNCACRLRMNIPANSPALAAIMKTARDGEVRALAAGTFTSNFASPIAVYRATQRA